MGSRPYPIKEFATSAQAVLELAAGTIAEHGFCAFLRANVKRE
jgi:hypothetical protein